MPQHDLGVYEVFGAAEAYKGYFLFHAHPEKEKF
jgi:hypothetical protein